MFDQRVTVRVAVPDGAEGEWGDAAVDAGGVEITRRHLRYKAWGGRRYLLLQAEARAGWVKAGRTVTWTIPIGK